jgi:hypothetical protein
MIKVDIKIKYDKYLKMEGIHIYLRSTTIEIAPGTTNWTTPHNNQQSHNLASAKEVNVRCYINLSHKWWFSKRYRLTSS